MLKIHSKATDTAKIVIGLAFALGLVNYLDRVVISFAVGPIQKDFGIDNASFGLAMSLFALGALAVNGISGVLLDRYGARRIWSLGLIVWSLTMFMLGWIHYWWLFLAFRVLLGFGEGVNFPGNESGDCRLGASGKGDSSHFARFAWRSVRPAHRWSGLKLADWRVRLARKLHGSWYSRGWNFRCVAAPLP